MSFVDRAHKVLFPHSIHPIEEWKKAEKILEEFDVPKLSEDLSLGVLCEIILFTFFPNLGRKTRCIRRAEEKLPELLGVNPDHEFHMAEVEVIWDLLREGKSAEEISQMFGMS